MTRHIGFRCSAVLAILVVVATAGNLCAGEWRHTPYFTEDFAPDPGWDTYVDGISQVPGYPEENFIRVIDGRMVSDMEGFYSIGLCSAAPTVAQLAPIEDVQATSIVRMEVLTDDLYPGLILRGNNLDNLFNLMDILDPGSTPTTGTAYAYVVSGWNEVDPYPNSVGMYALYPEPGDQTDHTLSLIPIVEPPWDTTDLIDTEIYMKFSARTTPDGKVQLDGMLSLSADFSSPFGVISVLDDPLGDADPDNDPLAGAGRVAVAGGNFYSDGGPGHATRAKWDDVTVYKHSGPGDANGDNVVDLLDLGVVGDNWNGTGKTWEEGDFNYDGVVDLLDLGVVGDNWGANYTEGAAAVPEPSTLTLLVLGAIAALLYRKQRSSL